MSEKLEEFCNQGKRTLFSSLCYAREKATIHQCHSDFAAKWYEDTARQYIKKYSDVSLNLPTHSFGDLKTKVRKLVADSKEISERALSQPGIWWHEKPELHTAVLSMII